MSDFPFFHPEADCPVPANPCRSICRCWIPWGGYPNPCQTLLTANEQACHRWAAALPMGQNHCDRVLEEHLFAPGQTLQAPRLLDIEVAQVVRGFASRGEIHGERGREPLDDFGDFRLRRYPHGFLLPRVWASRNNVTAYDAVYIALAEALDAVLLTRDRRLVGAAGHHARVALV